MSVASTTGAVAGAAAGGAIAGPLGAAVGGKVGAVVGGKVGEKVRSAAAAFRSWFDKEAPNRRKKARKQAPRARLHALSKAHLDLVKGDIVAYVDANPTGPLPPKEDTAKRYPTLSLLYNGPTCCGELTALRDWWRAAVEYRVLMGVWP